jgi:hypothetical protein
VEVTMRDPAAFTPRMVMHVCSASMKTPARFGSKVRTQPVGDLLGQPLLHLRPTREMLDDTRQLGQPEDAAAG